jgi:hypothetical protein
MPLHLNKGELMYKILGQDGKEYGPVNADTLRQWLTQGRLNAQTRVCAEGATEWKPLAEFPELALIPMASTPSAAAPAAQPLAQASLPVPAQQTGLAIASLVLGIISVLSIMCGGILLGLPAIITGHMAVGRARRSPAVYGGKGMAIAGLALGYFSLVLTALMIASFFFWFAPNARFGPARQASAATAESIQCVNNLKQIGLAARLYSNDNGDTFPKDFLSMSNELNTPKILRCPADKSRTRADDWASFSPANVSYEFLVPGAKEKDVVRTPVFRCPIHKSICFGDGSVERGDQRRPR